VIRRSDGSTATYQSVIAITTYLPQDGVEPLTQSADDHNTQTEYAGRLKHMARRYSKVGRSRRMHREKSVRSGAARSTVIARIAVRLWCLWSLSSLSLTVLVLAFATTASREVKASTTLLPRSRGRRLH